MGCDIHMYIEYKRKDGESWNGFAGRINPGRNYSIFSNLASVRGESENKPKGRLLDMAYEARSDDSIYISETPSEDLSYTPEQAAEMVAKGYCQYTDERKAFITNSDHHSHSWGTADEIEDAVNKETWGGNHEYRALIAIMRSFEASDFECRCVYWFDN